MSFLTQGSVYMQQNVKVHRNPRWRKIATIVFLPIIIFIWLTGWTVTQIEEQKKYTKINQEKLQTQTELKAHEESNTVEEESKIANEPITA